MIIASAINDKQKKIFEDELEMNLAIAYSDIGRFRVNIFRREVISASSSGKSS